MTDTFDILASISAVLSGFSLAFLGVMLTFDRESKAADRTARLATVSAAVFLITALGWALSASELASITAAEAARALEERHRQLHQILSMFFLAGVALFMLTLAASGWVRSRRLGWFTTIVSVGSGLVATWVLSFFIR
jgi:signal transduction histidine kinase